MIILFSEGGSKHFNASNFQSIDHPLQAGVVLLFSVDCLRDQSLDRGSSKTRSLILISFLVHVNDFIHRGLSLIYRFSINALGCVTF